MTIITMKSDEARSKFRDILDEVYAGNSEVVIERYSKPTAVMVNFQEWQKLKEMKRQQRRQQIEQARKDIDAGNYFTHEQVEAGLRERELID